jgi:hypothetical protein
VILELQALRVHKVQRAILELQVLLAQQVRRVHRVRLAQLARWGQQVLLDLPELRAIRVIKV